MNKELIDQLIQLSKIFKQGYTIELKNGNLNQYTNYIKRYIVSYKTIILNDSNVGTLTILPLKGIPDKCIIGGWLDFSGVYHIELNKAFFKLRTAIKYAKNNKQKAIYNIITGNILRVWNEL